MQRDQPAEDVYWAVELFRDRWFVPVLHRLLEGSTRQAEFLREIPGISQRMLTRTLREMEGNGLVTRRLVRAKPIWVEYKLTEVGLSLKPVLEAILYWARQNRPRCG